MATRVENPKIKASFWSHLTFFYTRFIFERGCNLSDNQIYEVLPSLKASYLKTKLNKYWFKEVNSAKPSLTRALLRCFGPYYFILGIIQFAFKTTLIFLNPDLISKFLNCFNQTSSSGNNVYFYGTSIILVNIISCIYNHNYMLFIAEISIKVRVAVTSLIFDKILRLDTKYITDQTSGEIETRITKDVFIFEKVLIFLNDLWIGTIHTVLIFWLIHQKISGAYYIGCTGLLVVVILQVFIGKIVILKARLKAAKQTDCRMSQLNEILWAIKVIKIYCWEEFFLSKLQETRKIETKHLKLTFFGRSFNLCLGELFFKSAVFLMLTSYLTLTNKTSTKSAIYVLTCFANLRSFVSITLPLGVSQLSELLAALQRIETFLLKQEYSLVKTSTIETPNIEWTKPGLYLISGQNGSGKTTLLKTILEQQTCVSYAPQEPWLLSDTIKENILFGQKFDVERYEEVLKVCQLKHDLARMKNGDLTVVTVQGLNLSRGQQQRISLARAVYKQSNIYLLDEILTNLDHQVGDLIIKECILKFLSQKIVILTTDNLKKLRNFARESLIIENGKMQIFKPNDVEEANNFVVKKLEISSHPRDLVETKIYQESNQTGSVSLKNYQTYLKYLNDWKMRILMLSLFILCQVADSSANYLLTTWISTFDQNNKKSMLAESYEVVLILLWILAFARIFCTFSNTTTASRNIFNDLSKSIIFAKLSFFNENLLGSISNRFSRDISGIDEALPFILYENLKLLCTITGVLTLIIVANFWFIIPISLLLSILFYLRRYYLRSARILKRLETVNRSPLVGYVNSTLHGLAIIRTYELKDQAIFAQKFNGLLDHFTSTNYMLICTTRAFGFLLDMLNWALTAVIIIYCIHNLEMPQKYVTLALIQATSLTGLLQWAIRQWADLETQMTSVERIQEYINCDQEDLQTLNCQCFNNDSLSVEFNKMSDKTILNNISFTIPTKHKVGLIGRTGSGKSSILSAILRLNEIEHGKITFNKMDITKIGLRDLRSQIAVIPQEKIIFTGTIRSNIDPFNEYKDEMIWSANTRLGKPFNNLYEEVNRKSSLSSYQLQSLCFLRIMFKKYKMILMDEITLNQQFQEVLEEYFGNVTGIIVSHKIEDYTKIDQVIELEDGLIKDITTKL